MSGVDTEGVVLLAKVAAAAAAIIGPVVLAYVWLDSRFVKRRTVEEYMKTINEELKLHRDYFKDVFNKVEEHARRDEEVHRGIMETMSSNHAEVLRELGRKADR